MMVSHTTAGQSSHSVNRTANTNISDTVTLAKPLFGQMISGWVTVTQTDTDGSVMYGPFDTVEKAIEWGSKLINASIEPIYVPAYNRG